MKRELPIEIPKRKIKILVGCERSGIIRDALNAIDGIEAWSCDLARSETESDRHIQGDVLAELRASWTAAIFHPDCTYLTVAAEWAYKPRDVLQERLNLDPGKLYGIDRLEARVKALKFVETLLSAPIDHIALENPAYNVIGKYIRPYDQAINPHEFGHDASKKTGLWLKGLPPLIPTNHVAPRWVCGCGRVETPREVLLDHVCIDCGADMLPRWGNQTDSGQNRESPGAGRMMRRARTYKGWADAMASQWGSYLKKIYGGQP